MFTGMGYQGAEYVFSEDWGEQEVEIKNPVLIILDLSTETCSVMTTGEYADISMGQVEDCEYFKSELYTLCF